MTRRSRTSVAYLCIVVVALAAFLPGGAAFEYVVPERPWIQLPDLAADAIAVAAPAGDEQPASLLSSLSPRAPPLTLS